MRRWIRQLQVVWVIVLSTTSIGASAQIGLIEGETITTTEIMEESLELSCVDFKVVGVCIWLTCTPFGCALDYSVQVHHYMPDLTVSAYADTGENPWTDVARFSQPTIPLQDGGNNTEGSTVINETALRFKEADVYGNPAIQLLSKSLGNTDYFCKSEAIMMFPYFLSVYDPFWREPILETPFTLLNLFRIVGYGKAPLQTSSWGPVYPRIGLVQNGHDYKAGAVAAQRAANIVTKKKQLHVYKSVLRREFKQGYWPPGEAVEGDMETAQWQQLLPRGNTAPACHVFADKDDQLSAVLDPFMDRTNELTGYVWNLWRPYSCCERQGAVLIAYNPLYTKQKR
ncbi:MAG: TIGR03756 family integrating conjugative element protein [Pseudomonadota bacterium]